MQLFAPSLRLKMQLFAPSVRQKMQLFALPPETIMQFLRLAYVFGYLHSLLLTCQIVTK